MGPDRPTDSTLTARDAGLVACHVCGKLWPRGTDECGRCHAHLHTRRPRSVQRSWAWLIAGLIAYVPANLYPIMTTNLLGRSTPNTIVGGLLELIGHHSYFVALIVFLASIFIPIGNFLVVGFLLLSIQRRWNLPRHERMRLYQITEFIGRWSMIDVFVVAILASLVQFGALATIEPGIAASAFAITVVFTMLAASSLDPRLIWDTGAPRRQGEVYE